MRPSLVKSEPLRAHPAASSELQPKGKKQPDFLVRYAYYVFVFSIPFDMMEVGFNITNFSLSKLIGYGFLAVCVVQEYIWTLRIPKAFWYFAAYLSVYAILGFRQDPEFLNQIFGRLLSLIQMMVLFLISYRLMHWERIAKGALLALSVACILLVCLQVFQIGYPVHDLSERVAAGGQEENNLGCILALGILALVGLAYGRTIIDRRLRFMACICFGILALGTVLTGSRGAMVGLVVGLLIFFLKGRSITFKVKAGLVSLVAVACLIATAYQFEFIRSRWEETFIEGSMSRREEIFPKAFAMALEKPIIGWGPVNNTVELAERTSSFWQYRDTHNLYLWVLTETGLLGSVPFFLGLWCCWRAAWRARTGKRGILPLAMLSCLLVINMSLTWHNRKLHWLVLAYALAGTYGPTVRREPRANRLKVRSISPTSILRS